MVCRKIHGDDRDLIFHLFILLPGLFKHRLFSAARRHRGCLLFFFFIVVSNSIIRLVKSWIGYRYCLVLNKCITLTVTHVVVFTVVIDWDVELENGYCQLQSTFTHMFLRSNVWKQGWIVLEWLHNSKLNGTWITVDLHFETAYFYNRFACLALTWVWRVGRNLFYLKKCVCVHMTVCSPLFIDILNDWVKLSQSFTSKVSTWLLLETNPASHLFL